MNTRDLKYLVAIADHKHFGKAAEASFVSQPALSMQIKKLEQVLGVQLIERNNKSVMLTDIGKLITEHARDILNRVDNMKDLAKQASDPFSGELHLGIIPTLAPYLLPHIMPPLIKTFPKLTIYLIEEQTEYLITKLKHGKIDAAFLALPLIDEEFTVLPLFNEELLLATPPNHVLAKRKHIQLTDLENKTLLLLADGHCLRDQALSLCHSAHAKTEKSFQATSLETLRHMVASKAGITLMPKLSCQANDGLCYLPFSSPKPTRTIGLAWRSSSAKKILLEDIVIQTRKILSKQKAVKMIHTSLLYQRKS